MRLRILYFCVRGEIGFVYQYGVGQELTTFQIIRTSRVGPLWYSNNRSRFIYPACRNFFHWFLFVVYFYSSPNTRTKAELLQVSATNCCKCVGQAFNSFVVVGTCAFAQEALIRLLWCGLVLALNEPSHHGCGTDLCACAKQTLARLL